MGMHCRGQCVGRPQRRGLGHVQVSSRCLLQVSNRICNGLQIQSIVEVVVEDDVTILNYFPFLRVFDAHIY